MDVSSTCRLCGQTKPLQGSHIIPKFVFDWMRKTGSGYIRVSGNPNKRAQDGDKRQVLCRDCEQLFSRREKWFSENVFAPYMDDSRNTFVYDESLFYFLLSVLWRVLLDTFPELEPTHCHRAQLVQAEIEWRKCLLGGGIPPNYSEVHLLLTDVIIPGGYQPVVNFSQYLTRSIDSTIASGRSRCCVYAKFARFVCFGAITPFDPHLLVGTKVDPHGGTLSCCQAMRDGHIGEFLADRARSAHEAFIIGLSDRQNRVIAADIAKKLDRIITSDVSRAMIADHEATVDPLALWPKVAADSRCPCGSGKKFAECHGEKSVDQAEGNHRG